MSSTAPYSVALFGIREEKNKIGQQLSIICTLIQRRLLKIRFSDDFYGTNKTITESEETLNRRHVYCDYYDNCGNCHWISRRFEDHRESKSFLPR